MNLSEKDKNQISSNLLFFLRKEFDDTKIVYEIPPTKLQGGYDSSVFHFKLKNVHPSLSGPLVLRVFRYFYMPNQAIIESSIHISLVDQEFSVPYVYYACIDDKYLGNQFLFMDFIAGALLPKVFGNDTAIVLGKTHATLHNVDSSRLSKVMIAMDSIDDRESGIKGWLDYLQNVSERLHWLECIVVWLMENKPADCAHRSICHGDFHPYNLLAKDDKATAILDWSACMIGDPAMDVATTTVVFNAATKHIIPSFDSKVETQKYLNAYKGEKDLNEQHFGYYQTLGCLLRLIAGGSIWAQPNIQNELVNIIYEFSRIHLDVP